MASATKSMSKTFVWIIVGLLCFAMIGFGASGLGGTVTTIGSVGDRKIGVQDYVRAIRSEMQAFEAQTGTPVTFQQAQAFGLDQRALRQLVTTAALEHEAGELGLSIGDENLRDQILSIRAFQGPDGQFDRTAYRFALENAGLNENTFEEDLRAESARTLLQSAVLAGTPMPATYGEALVSFIGEERAFTWARLSVLDLAEPLAEPDTATLRAFYEDNIAQFTRPETRAITYAWLTPDMLLDEIDTPEDALRELYEERAELYNQPERRLVERLAYISAEEADAARARLDAGELTFDELVAERGLALTDVDLGDVARSDLEPGAQEPVFAAAAGDIVGPAPSEFGPALYRVNAILAAQSTPFEEARDDLAAEYQRDRAARLIETQLQPLEDLLAGGATIEELADETDMTLGTLDWTAESDAGVAAYPAFGARAAATEPGDFPELGELSDGGIFALRVDEVRPPEPEPFDDVTEEVAAAWRSAETGARLLAQAEELAAQLGEGRTFEALSLTPRSEQEMIRRSFIEGAPNALILTAFEMTRGEVRAIPAGEEAILVRLDSITAPDLASDDSTQLLGTVTDQVSGGIAQDLFQALANDAQARAGIALDQQAITAVHTQFAGGL